MKTSILLILATFVFTGFGAFAERDTQGIVWVRVTSEAQLDPQVRLVAQQINDGSYRGHLNDDCGHGRRARKVYGIDIKGKSYRADRYGNLHPQWTAVVKYRCR